MPQKHFERAGFPQKWLVVRSGKDGEIVRACPFFLSSRESARFAR